MCTSAHARVLPEHTRASMRPHSRCPSRRFPLARARILTSTPTGTPRSALRHHRSRERPAFRGVGPRNQDEREPVRV